MSVCAGRVAFAAAGLVLLAPAQARAGWHARFSLKGDHQPPLESHIYYEAGRLRLERPEGALILGLADGTITTVSHEAGTWTTTSLDELATLHGETRRAGASAASAPLQQEAGAKSVTVGSFTCDVRTWKTQAAEGELCSSESLGADLGRFPAEMASFAQRLGRAGDTPLARALFDLAQEGFPVRSVQRVRFGPRTLEKTLLSIESANVPPSLFLPPAGYAERRLPR